MWRTAILSCGLIGLVATLVFLANSVPANPPAEAKVAPPRAAKEAAPLPATNGTKIAVSRVTAITVYPNSALVTREVDVPEGHGTLELVVTPLPPQTVN